MVAAGPYPTSPEGSDNYRAAPPYRSSSPVTGDYHGLRHELRTELEKLEGNLSFRLHINSGLRSDKHSSHQRGLAADIRVTGGWERREVVKAALEQGFERIGVYDHHVHLDIDPDRPRPVLWSGISR